ncbi:MAG: hypothetical protein KGM42_06190 [Hyphomicrobiales bacterium]|nr:hypothetical protein [Hyphomicrobiales bacterium]
MGAARSSQGDIGQRTRRNPTRAVERLRYIAEMAGELAALAGGERQPMLTYFLNMARVEAEMQIAERNRQGT